MKFGVNPAPSHIPGDWLDRINPFLPADSLSQPNRLEDDMVVPSSAVVPEPPCTQSCCREDV